MYLFIFLSLLRQDFPAEVLTDNKTIFSSYKILFNLHKIAQNSRRDSSPLVSFVVWRITSDIYNHCIDNNGGNIRGQRDRVTAMLESLTRSYYNEELSPNYNKIWCPGTTGEVLYLIWSTGLAKAKTFQRWQKQRTLRYQQINLLFL